MIGQGEIYRGIVLLESLRPGGREIIPARRIRQRYQYLLDGQIPVTVLRLEVPKVEVTDLARNLSHFLRPRKFYAHFVSQGRLVVVFPGRVMSISRGNWQATSLAQSFGAGLGIPRHQMDFPALFDEDHPQRRKEKIPGGATHG